MAGKAEQFALFADRGPLTASPPGLSYRADFLTPEQEGALIARIAELPLAPFQFGIYEGKREVVYFGARYDFTRQRVEPADPLPDWILPVAHRVERVAGLAPGAIGHALITRYEVGAGIGWHRDKKQFDEVFGLSLGSACTLRFRRRRNDRWERHSLLCAPRSLYVLSGEARASWEHSIAPVETKRYSVTFRTMRPAPSE